MTDRRALLLALAAAVAAAWLAVLVVPYAEPLFFHLDAARELLATGRITDHHAPGYALLLAAALHAGGLAGVLTLHALVLAAATGMAWRVVRAAGLPPLACLGGALTVALNPILVANVTKISDTDLSVLLLLAVVAGLMRVRDTGLRWGHAVPAATLGAVVLLVRPNLALLAPVALWLGLRGRDAGGRTTAASVWVASVVLSAGIALSVNAAVTGAWRLSDPYYLAYTFHNGTNPRAAEHILRDTIGEYSTYRALEDEGIEYARLSKEELTPIYWRLGVEFVTQHPWRYAGLLGAKALNFFRPYLRPGRDGPAAIVATVVEVVLALPVVVWGVLRWRARGAVPGTGLLLAAVVLPLYVLPFVLINSEPRYRWPIDTLLVLESVVLLHTAWPFIFRSPLSTAIWPDLWQTVRRSGRLRSQRTRRSDSRRPDCDQQAKNVRDSGENRAVPDYRARRTRRDGRPLPRPRRGPRARRRAQDDAPRLHGGQPRPGAVPA
jgi:hypothetical protein